MARNDIEYTATIGMITAKTANGNLDGTGTTVVVLTNAAAAGITINRVVIKAEGDTSEGMVRLFIDNGSTVDLLEEVTIGARTCSPTVPTTSQVVTFAKGFVLEMGHKLRASTEVAESFNVLAEGLEWGFPASETRVEQEGFTTRTSVKTANPNRDGTGSLGTILTGTDRGARINSLSIKSLGNTTDGMIRLFFKHPGGATKLQREFRVPQTTQTAVVPAYGRMILFPGGLSIPAGWSLMASTENTADFMLIAEGYTWKYV